MLNFLNNSPSHQALCISCDCRPVKRKATCLDQRPSIQTNYGPFPIHYLGGRICLCLYSSTPKMDPSKKHQTLLPMARQTPGPPSEEQNESLRETAAAWKRRRRRTEEDLLSSVDHTHQHQESSDTTIRDISLNICKNCILALIFDSSNKLTSNPCLTEEKV